MALKFGIPRSWKRLRRLTVGTAVLSVLSVVAIADGVANEDIQVRVNRWLEVRQTRGQVSLLQQGRRQAARIGSRLQAVGEGLTTSTRSRAILAVDTSVGFIDVSESTALQIRELRQMPDGGRVTRLTVSQGQARLRVRPFTHNSSELEIETPAGWSAVRGTEFGVSVHPDGKTGVATLEGAVTTGAQGEQVDVESGFQTLVIPGEPPQPPTPLDGAGDTRLRLRLLTTLDRETAKLEGRIDPVNLLVINDEIQTISREGVFDLEIPLPPNRLIRARVITPLGSQQTYDLAVP